MWMDVSDRIEESHASRSCCSCESSHLGQTADAPRSKTDNPGNNNNTKHPTEAMTTPKEGRESPGPGPEGINPATAAQAPERVAQSMAARRHHAHQQRRRGGKEGAGGGRRRHRHSNPPACVGPEEMCHPAPIHDGLPSATYRHVAEADRIPQPIYLGG